MPFARLKPVNERRGHRVRVYMFEGFRFLVEKGWYEISESMADKLRDLRQEHYDDDSASLFDVVSTREAADRLDEKERQNKLNAQLNLRRAPAAGSRQTTQPLPVNNAGGIEGLPEVKESGGDLSTVDLERNIHGTQPVGNAPPPEGNELEANADTSEEQSDEEGRHTDVGRTGEGPKNRRRHGR
jgi:hypothetical protein